MSERNRHLWPIVSAALIGVPILYQLSVVPLIWLLDQPQVPHAVQVFAYFYALPLLWSREQRPTVLEIAGSVVY